MASIEIVHYSIEKIFYASILISKWMKKKKTQKLPWRYHRCNCILRFLGIPGSLDSQIRVRRSFAMVSVRILHCFLVLRILLGYRILVHRKDPKVFRYFQNRCFLLLLLFPACCTGNRHLLRAKVRQKLYPGTRAPGTTPCSANRRKRKPFCLSFRHIPQVVHMHWNVICCT